MGGAIADAYGYSATFYVTALLLLLSGLTVRFWVHEPPRVAEPAPPVAQLAPPVAQLAPPVAQLAPPVTQLAPPVTQPAPPVTQPAPPDPDMQPVEEHAAPAPTGRRSPAFLRRGFFRTWGEILTAPSVRAVYGLSFLNQLSRNMLLPVVPLFVPLLLHGSGLVNTFTGLVAGASSATTTLSSGYLGRLGDRKGQRRVLIIALLAASVLFAVQAGVQAGWQLLLLQGLVGVALGGITPAISALLARNTRPGLEGAVYGLENAVGSGARTVAPMLGSAVMLWWGLRSTFLVTGGLLLLTALFALLSLPDQEHE
jgi:predicted MFS family arabinose efflux permease